MGAKIRLACALQFLHAGSFSRASITELLQATAAGAADIPRGIWAADDQQPCHSESWGSRPRPVWCSPNHLGASHSETAFKGIQVSSFAHTASKQWTGGLAARVLSRTPSLRAPLAPSLVELIESSENVSGKMYHSAYSTVSYVSTGSLDVRASEQHSHFDVTREQEAVKVSCSSGFFNVGGMYVASQFKFAAIEVEVGITWFPQLHVIPL